MSQPTIRNIWRNWLMGRANVMWTPSSTYKKERMREDRFGHIAIIPFVSLVCFSFFHPDGNVTWFIPMSGFVSCMEAKWLSISMTGSTCSCLLFVLNASSLFTENWHADMQMECWNKTAYGIVQKDRNSDIIIESYHLRILFSFSFHKQQHEIDRFPDKFVHT